MTTMSDSYFQDGAAESSAIFHQYYGLSQRWGKNRPVGLTMRFVAPPSPKPEVEPGPYADIRHDLVSGFRYADKPAKLKHYAELWACVIDEIERTGENADTTRAFHERRVDFMRAAEGATSPTLVPYPEIAKALELGERAA